jgi:hypothetical protein
MHRLSTFVLSICLSACASGSGSTVQPAVALVAPKPPPPPVLLAPPATNLPSNWQDWPMAGGDWVYKRDANGATALFGRSGNDALFIMRCDRPRQRLIVSRAGAFPDGVTGRMSIRTTSALQTYPVANSGQPPSYVSAEIMTADRHLDAMVFSRGKFVISVKGASDLVIPAWAEVARIVEDCRG